MTNEEQAKQTSLRNRRTRVGEVVSRSGEKTASVVVNNLVKHGQYGKFVRRRTRVAVHDEKQQANVGDLVEIAPSRRMSKRKAHRLVRVVRTKE